MSVRLLPTVHVSRRLHMFFFLNDRAPPETSPLPPPPPLPLSRPLADPPPLPRAGLERSPPRHGLDAPDAGGDGALGRDLHQAELARPLQVRAPAQLRREVA